MAGRLQRQRNRATGAITGYIFDGQHYDPQQFNRLLQEMLKKNDPWAQQVVEKLPDFQSLRSTGAISRDPELVSAEIEDLNLKIGSPDVSAVEKVKAKRRITELEQVRSGMTPAGMAAGRPITPQDLSEASQRAQRRDQVDQYRFFIASLERSLGRKPTQQEIDQFISFLSK